MVKSACIELLAPNIDFYERFEIVKKSGFEAIEFWTWKDKDIDRIKEICEKLNLSISSISGDMHFSLCDPKHFEQYVDFAIESFEVAKKLNAKNCVLHSNALGEGGVVVNHYNDLRPGLKFAQIYKGLSTLVEPAKRCGVTMVVEPLNTVVDHVGNFLDNTYDISDIVRIVDSPNCKVLYDVYHMQIMHGNILDTLETCIDTIGLIHVADVPGRNEPGTGEINYPMVFDKLNKLKYLGYIAFELSPRDSYEKATDAIMAL